jgi:hypothetical protein
VVQVPVVVDATQVPDKVLELHALKEKVEKSVNARQCLKQKGYVIKGEISQAAPYRYSFRDVFLTQNNRKACKWPGIDLERVEAVYLWIESLVEELGAGEGGGGEKQVLLLPDATLSHMVKECKKLFSAFLCSKKRNQKSRLITIDNN